MQGFTSVQKMAQDSTPVLRESLNKCFAEQHDIANGDFTEWCFDQQQNVLKQLTVQYEDLEDKVELIDCFFTQLDGNQEENRGNLEKLEKRVTNLEGHLGKLEDRVEIVDEGDDKRLDQLEERVVVLNTQNIELRDHLNLMIDTLNSVVKVLNSQGSTDEVATPQEENQDGEVLYPKQDMDEDTQPSLSQVYAMYQSQPPDEEGRDEMTSAIEAAEEREARKKVSGLTKDEWQDLLRLK